MARLHTERVVRGDARPARWLLVAHGILGAGMNWRGIARKIIERRPEWGVLLVDLRNHGRSEAGEPPHTIAACAEDVAAAIAREDIAVDAIAGHSFGGKVMMATRALVEPTQTWILDASPSPYPGAFEDDSNSVTRVLKLMMTLPTTWPRRDDFVAAVVAAGNDVSFANWLAMNVVAQPDGTYANRLDLAAIREMIADYWAQDLWNAIDAPGGDLEYVLADRSRTVTAADRLRLETAPPHVHVHHIDAGHWLHIEAPAAVIELVATRLP